MARQKLVPGRCLEVCWTGSAQWTSGYRERPLFRHHVAAVAVVVVVLTFTRVIKPVVRGQAPFLFFSFPLLFLLVFCSSFSFLCFSN